MFGRELLRPGMMVHTSDGQKLGKIQSLEADGFIIEKGLIFKKEYSCRYDLVSDVRGDDVIISRKYADIGRDETSQSTAGAWTGTERGERMSDRTDWNERSTADVNIPVVEEELDVTKHSREAGAVRVHKDVITEEKTVTVPVTRERVTVERVPVAEGSYAAGDTQISGGDVTIPVREEEIEVRKRPVVREEVRVRKDRFEERRAVSETVRKEDVTIDDDTDLNRRSGNLEPDTDDKTRY